MNVRKYIICDLDGLLFDSERLVFGELQRVFKAWGKELTHADYRQYIGLDIHDMAELIGAQHSISNPIEILRSTFQKVYFENERRGPPLKPGVHEFLETAQRAGVAMAIGTSSDIENALAFIRAAQIEKYFSFVVGGNQVAHAKPHPDIYLKVLKLFPCHADEAVVLEDSDRGVLAAHNAGIRSIHIPDLYPASAETTSYMYASYASLHHAAKHLSDILRD